MNSGRRFIAKWMRFFGMFVLPPLLVGCGATAFRQDFKGYNDAYADMLNEQMLLNLARLDNGHPAQFLAIGAINSRYAFNASTSAGISPTHTDTSTATAVTGTSGGGGVLGAILRLTGRTLSDVSTMMVGSSGSLTAAETSQPEFQWIPLNNETVTRQILDPVNPDVFYTLYQQGFPIDQLLRVTVERIEITLPNGQYLVLSNSPTRSSYIQTTHEWESFSRFLRVCGMLRELQRHGLLSVEATPKYIPLGNVEFKKAASSRPGNGGGNRGGGSGDNNGGDNGSSNDSVDLLVGDPPDDPPPDRAAKNVPIPSAGPTKTPAPDFEPSPDQVLSAEKAGYPLRKVSEGVWQLGKYQEIPTFKLRPGVSAEAMRILETSAIHDDDDRLAARNLVDVLQHGFTIVGRVDEQLPVDTKTHLILRSFSRALEAVAVEQEAFAELMKDPEFPRHIPAIELRPVLQTRWPDKGGAPLERPLVKLDYSGKTYQITDPAGKSALDPSSTWNRDVYRLLMALNSQVTVDISKFQRQVFELQQ